MGHLQSREANSPPPKKMIIIKILITIVKRVGVNGINKNSGKDGRGGSLIRKRMS
jgi:hypothetical protein